MLHLPIFAQAVQDLGGVSASFVLSLGEISLRELLSTEMNRGNQIISSVLVPGIHTLE